MLWALPTEGLVHRDVKPENILLSGDHCPRGFPCRPGARRGRRRAPTETAIMFSTPTYLSPSNRRRAAAHGRSDIYSLGCVLYQMLAGDPPFTGRTAQAIIARRLSEPVPRLRTLRDVPASVEEVVGKALARSPADRFDDTSQFAQALQAAVGAQPAVPTEPTPAARHSAFRRRILLAATGALVAVAVLLGLYRGFRRAPDVTLDRNLLAIAPFDVLDPSLQLWREGLGDPPLRQPRRRRSAPHRVSHSRPAAVGRVARTEPPLRPSVTAPARGWSVRDRGPEGAGLGHTPRRRVGRREWVRPEGGRGLGRVREDRRAGGLTGNPDPSGLG